MENKEIKFIKTLKSLVKKESDKAINVTKKRLYSRTFKRIIEEHKDETNFPEDFLHLVIFIGKDWHVKRSLPHKAESSFAEHLWKNKDKIKDGSYKWTSSDFVAERKNKVKTHLYSYESKICFLIAPEKYKLIYDSHNIESMEKEQKDGHLPKNLKISIENWQEVVEEYYKKNHPDAKTDDDFFEVDFETWYRD